MTNYLKAAKRSVKNWYLLTISGIIFIGLGILVFKTPLDSYVNLAKVFSVAFLIAGVSELIYSIRNRKELDSWGWNLVSGIFTTLMGLALVIYPEISITSLPFIAAFVTMYHSLNAMANSFELRNYGVAGWSNMLAMGILGLILSFLLLVHPVFTGLSLVFLTGAAFIVVGIYSIHYSLKLRKTKKRVKKVEDKLKSGIEAIKREVGDQFLMSFV